MESQKTIKLYVYVDGINDVPFYGSEEYEEFILSNGEQFILSNGFIFNVRNVNEQIEIGSFRYDAKRMGAAPTISFTLMYEDCLDNFWNENVYATFNGEKYFLKQTPTSSLSNEDARYKHEVELISERVALDNVYFFDAVKNSTTNNDAVSNSATFSFFGDIVKFKDKLNESLRFANMQTVENGEVKGWEVIVDEGITSERMFIPFDEVFFSNAIQESYNTFKIPYYFTGKKIHFGYTDNAIAKEFSYGVDDALLSITKSNANNKIVNRVTATGSSDNIPYYYPNSYPKGEIDLTVSGSLSESDIKIVNKDSFQRLNINEEYTYLGDPSLNTIVKGVYIPSLWATPFRDGTATVEKLYIEDKSVDLEVRYDLFFDTETTTEIELSWELVNQCNPIINMTPPLENARGENQLEVKVDSLGIKSSTYQRGGAPSSGVITKKHSYYDSVTYRKNQTSTGKITNKNIDTGIKFSTPSLRGDVTIVVKLKLKTLGNFWSQVPDYFWGEGSKKKPYSDIVITTSVNTRTTGGWKTEDGVSINMANYGVKFLQNPQYGDSLKYNIVKYVTPSNVLLPPKYRERDGTERFYNATNGTYTDNNGAPIEFVNPYTEGHPREHIIKVEDIKPTIKGATVLQPNGSSGAGYILPIDMFTAFAYDEDDNDETYIDEEGETYFKHPYFFGRLRVLDFNLFDSANENKEMTISFTSGDCGACNFVIGATEDYPQINPVQVDANGNLKYKDGRVWCGLEGVQGQAVTEYQERQQDTSKYEVWVALKKDEDTYGTLMPTKNIRPKACTSATTNDGDTFVITGINLPQAYITRAEEKLEREIIKYMYENNVEKFKFSIKFSRIYFEENPDVLELLNENSRIYIWYNNIRYTLYVNSMSYYMESDGVLPDITVELDNELTLTQNAIQAAITQVKSEVGGALSNIDIATLGTPYFIRKDQDDEVQGKINFKKGIKFGEGGSVDLYDDNSAKLTIEYLEVTKKATFTSLEIQEKTHVGGQMLINPAAMNCGEVENILDEESGDVIAYRCYMQTKGQDGNEEIFNQFAVGDQAICQTFNTWGSKYYWRLVTAVGEDYIDLSVDDCDEESDIPEAGDKIIQLGHRTDKTRQAAQVLSAHGETAPAFIMYNGINDYTLEGKEVTGILWNPATQEPQMYSYGNFFFGNREKDENGEFKKDFITFQPNPENPEEKKLFINADVQFGGGSKGLSDLSEWQDLQGEVDTATETALQASLVNLLSVEKTFEGQFTQYAYYGEILPITVNAGEKYTFHIENISMLSGTSTRGAYYCYLDDLNNNWLSDSAVGYINESGVGTLTINAGVSNAQARFIISKNEDGASSATVRISKMSLVKGTRPMMTWKQNTDYLTNAFKDGTTKIQGGLTMTQAVMVEDGSGVVKGMLNGSNYAKDDTHGRLIVAAGSQGVSEANMKTATTRIYEDGTVVTNQAEIKKGCKIADIEVSERGLSFTSKDNGAVSIDEDGLNVINRVIAGQLVSSSIGQCGQSAIQIVVGSTGKSCYTSGTGNPAGLIISVPETQEAMCVSSGMMSGLRPYLNTNDLESGHYLTEFEHTAFATSGTIYLPTGNARKRGQTYKILHYSTGTLRIVAQDGLLREFKGSSGMVDQANNTLVSNVAEVIEIWNGGTNWYFVRHSS